MMGSGLSSVSVQAVVYQSKAEAVMGSGPNSVRF